MPFSMVSQACLFPAYILPARYSGTDRDSVKTFYLPSLGIIAQGTKSVTVGQETYRLDRGLNRFSIG